MTAKVAPRGPLEGVRVVDLTLAYAGPFATLLLGGLGAEVIKVENPRDGDMARTNPPFMGRAGVKMDREEPDDMSLAFINRGRNKKSVTLNLKMQKGQAIMRRLLKDADIFVENFALGATDRLGIGYDAVREINPRLIYCSIKGYGTEGADTGKAMDIMVQARSGVMGAMGRPGDPPMRASIPFGDLAAPMMSVIGILSALWHRERTGQGQFIDISLLDVLTALVAGEHYDALAAYGLEIRTGNSLARMSPFGAYCCADGGWVAIAAPTDLLASKLFACMGKDDLLADPRFATRNQRTVNTAAVDEVIGAWTATADTATILGRLNSAGVPATDVKMPQEAVHDPLVRGRGAVVPLTHPVYGTPAEMMGAGMPLRFSATPCAFTEAAPLLGQHNAEVFGDLGMSGAEIAELRATGVI